MDTHPQYVGICIVKNQFWTVEYVLTIGNHVLKGATIQGKNKLP